MRAIVMLLALVLAACGSSHSSEDGEGGTETEGVELGALRIVRVEVNQGVGVEIGRGEVWLDQDERFPSGIPVPLIRDRTLLVRVLVEVDPGWVPRDIRAELELSGAGEPTVLERTLRVEDDSNEQALETQFWWVLEPEAVRPQLQYQVRIFDGDGESMAQNPKGGPNFIGIQDDAIELAIELVPIRHCDSFLPVTDDVVERVRAYMHQRYPVQRVVVTTHDEVEYEGDAESLPNWLKDLRDQEGIGPHVFFMGWLAQNPCTAYSCITGGTNVPPIASAGRNRVGVWVPWDDIEDHLDDHCFGWIQGRGSVAPCDDQGPQDTDYPHADGRTMGWGWGVEDGILRQPDYYDLASCWPKWQSDYGWNKAFFHHRDLTALDEG